MEHKIKKVVENNAPGNNRRQPLGKGYENKSQRVGERKCEKERLREAIPYHFSCFFIKLIKGGGVIPVYKNLCCGFYIFWRALAT